MRMMIATVLATWMAVPAGATVLYPDEYEWRSGSTYVRMLIPADDPLSPKLLDANWLGCCDGWGPTSFDGRYIVANAMNGTEWDYGLFRSYNFKFKLSVRDGPAYFTLIALYRQDPRYIFKTTKFRTVLEGAWDRPLPEALTSLAPVPLPAAGGMLLAGLIGLFGIRRGRRSAG